MGAPHFERVARVLPRLRNDCEASRRLAAHGVERARRLAERAIAPRCLLEARLRQPRADRSSNTGMSNAAAQELVRVSHERDLQLGIVAHECGSRSPPRSLRIVCSRSPRTPARARAVLTRQLAHSSALIDNLLDYSRLTAQQIAAPRDSVDGHEIVNQAIETVAAGAAGRAPQIAVDHGRPAEAVGDPVCLRQAFINPLQNAVRYTPVDGRIGVRVSSDDEGIAVRARDTGEDSPRDRLETIFKPFVRGFAAGQGLGIGLALVRRIVEMHGGGVIASSDGPGSGSQFIVRFQREVGHVRL
jgi:signal transduction histidine kinase